MSRSRAYSCPVCESAGGEPYLDRFGIKMLRCGSCASLFMDPTQPSEAEYEEDYFKSPDSLSFGFSDYEAMSRHFRQTLERNMDALEARVSPPGRLLDIGAAMGDFVALARDRGWDARGLEVSRYAVERARERGLDVIRGHILEADPGCGFDAVTLLDTLEHMREPAPVMQRVAGLIRPGGVALITVPHYLNPMGRLLGRRWFGFNKVREHPVYFSPAGLRLLLERSGFEDISVRPWGWWTSGEYVLEKAAAAAGPVGWAARFLARFDFIGRRTVNFRFINMMAVAVRSAGG